MDIIIYDVSSDEEDAQVQLASNRRWLRDSSNPLDMDNKTFVTNFRLSKEAFTYVLNQIADRLNTSKIASAIPPLIKLTAALRFCAQGSYQLGIGNDSNVACAQSTVSVVHTEVLQALEALICPVWINFNYTEDEIQKAKMYFYEKSEFPGVYGAIDGTHIRIVAPKKDLQHLYYNRKGFYSLNAMAVCDHNMVIRYINAKHPGATHDSMVFQMSQLNAKLEEQHQNGMRLSWLLGDAGYALKPYLITPYRSAEEGSRECTFNKIHAKARNIIERTFGVLKNRFRCLLGVRALHYSPEKATKITNVCAALHNICVHFRVESPAEETYVDLEFNDDMLLNNENGEEQPVDANEGEEIRNRILLSFY